MAQKPEFLEQIMSPRGRAELVAAADRALSEAPAGDVKITIAKARPQTHRWRVGNERKESVTRGVLVAHRHDGSTHYSYETTTCSRSGLFGHGQNSRSMSVSPYANSLLEQIAAEQLAYLMDTGKPFTARERAAAMELSARSVPPLNVPERHSEINFRVPDYALFETSFASDANDRRLRYAESEHAACDFREERAERESFSGMVHSDGWRGILGYIAKRHDAGVYSIACDREACDHYGDKPSKVYGACLYADALLGLNDRFAGTKRAMTEAWDKALHAPDGSVRNLFASTLQSVVDDVRLLGRIAGHPVQAYQDAASVRFDRNNAVFQWWRVVTGQPRLVNEGAPRADESSWQKAPEQGTVQDRVIINLWRPAVEHPIHVGANRGATSVPVNIPEGHIASQARAKSQRFLGELRAVRTRWQLADSGEKRALDGNVDRMVQELGGRGTTAVPLRAEAQKYIRGESTDPKVLGRADAHFAHVARFPQGRTQERGLER